MNITATSGNMLLVVASCIGSGTPTVTDNASGGSNTYTLLTGGAARSWAWYAKNITGGTLALVLGSTLGTTQHAWKVFELSGADTTAPIRYQAHSATLSSGATSAGTAGDYVVGLAAWDDGSTQCTVTGSSFSSALSSETDDTPNQMNSFGTWYSVTLSYGPIAGANTENFTYTLSGTPSVQYDAWCVILKPAAGGTTDNLTGQGDETATGTATLTAAASLTASAAATATGAATLSEAAAVSASGTENATGAATVTSSASLGSIAAGKSTGTAVLTVTALLGSTAAEQETGAGTLSEAATLIATANETGTGSATVAVTQALTATAAEHASGTATLAEAAALTATAAEQETGTASLLESAASERDRLLKSRRGPPTSPRAAERSTHRRAKAMSALRARRHSHRHRRTQEPPQPLLLGQARWHQQMH